MRAGGGKQKGASFERKTCEALSLWITYGRKADCFWRSAMSGGRATVAKRKGKDLARQAGDITATAPEGNAMTAFWYIECKAVADLRLQSFFHRKGALWGYWVEACKQARAHGRQPMIIAKQNLMPAIVVVPLGYTSNLISQQLGYDLSQIDRMTFKFTGSKSAVVLKFDEMLSLCFPSLDISRRRIPKREKLSR